MGAEAAAVERGKFEHNFHAFSSKEPKSVTTSHLKQEEQFPNCSVLFLAASADWHLNPDFWL